MTNKRHKQFTRRNFIRAGLFTAGAAATFAAANAGELRPKPRLVAPPPYPGDSERNEHAGHGGLGAVGNVDHNANGFDPYVRRFIE